MVKAGLDDGARDKSASSSRRPWKAGAEAAGTADHSALAAAATREKDAGAAYLAKAAAEKGATKTASGLVYTTIKEGTGATPKRPTP